MAAVQRMRQSLSDIESAFADEMEVDRHRTQRAQRQAAKRARERDLRKTHKRGSMRFALLVLTLLATAVVVTIAMFQTLYYVMG